MALTDAAPSGGSITTTQSPRSRRTSKLHERRLGSLSLLHPARRTRFRRPAARRDGETATGDEPLDPSRMSRIRRSPSKGTPVVDAAKCRSPSPDPVGDRLPGRSGYLPDELMPFAWLPSPACSSPSVVMVIPSIVSDRLGLPMSVMPTLSRQQA